jgi:hypothetical protein
MGKGKYMDNFASMSDEEFMDAWTQLGSQAVADKARLSEFSQEHQRRERKKQLAAMDLKGVDLVHGPPPHNGLRADHDHSHRAQ